MTAKFLFEQVLLAKDRSMMSPEMPEKLADFYDPDEYAKQQNYENENSRYSLFFNIIAFGLSLVLFVFGIYGKVDDLVLGFTGNVYLQPMLFVSFFVTLSFIAGLPFALYDTFIIEEKYGFNKTTKKTFTVDQIKTFVIKLLLSAAIILIVAAAYHWFGYYFVPVCTLIILFFTLVAAYFYSVLIVPLFNKQTPLEDGSLKDAIVKFCEQTEFPVQGVYVIDGSRRSTKSNAYFTGFGKRKRICLYDTLLGELETGEIVAVLAHEIGHWKKKHALKSVIPGTAQTIFYMCAVYVCAGSIEIANVLGSSKPTVELGLQGAGMLFVPILLIFKLIGNVLSRKQEREADSFVRAQSLGPTLANALKKIGRSHLDNLTPHPWYVFWNYSHPPILERIERLGLKETEPGLPQ
jgi:STE24 endopeptidase